MSQVGNTTCLKRGLVVFESSAKSPKVCVVRVRSSASLVDFFGPAYDRHASCRRLRRTRQSADVKFGSMSYMDAYSVDKAEGNAATVRCELRRPSFNNVEELLDGVSEIFGE